MQSIIVFFLIILLTGLSILGSAHFFIYISLLNFFQITNQNAKITLSILFGLLSISFLVSSILVRSFDNFVTKQLYFWSGLWLGFLTYLVLSFAILWILSCLITDLPKAVIGTICITVSLSITSYGVWNAFHPRIKNLNIQIQNLPEQWEGKTIVQISDVHLGNVLGKGFLTKTVAQINDQKPNLVVITGDLLDGMGDDLIHSIAPINNIQSTYGTYFVTGNHETYLEKSEYLNDLQQTNVKLLKNEMVNLDGLQLIGINYPMQGEKIDLPKIINELQLNNNLPSVLLYHSPSQLKELSNTAIDLMLSGHTHKGQFFPYNLFTWLIYGKNHYGLHNINEMQIYTSSGTGSWGPTLRVWTRPEIVVIKLSKK